MKVLSTLDVRALEEFLLDRVVSRPRGGALDPLLILVPTRRLASHLKRRILERTAAALGVHILTHRGLAVRAMDHALEPPPRLLPQAALLDLLQDLLSDLAGPEGDYLRAHAGARSSLLATLLDLREAGMTSSDLERADAKDTTAEDCPPFLAPLYGRFQGAMEDLRAGGFADGAGLVRASLPHIPPFLRRKGIRLALHHGAYGLVEAHLELLLAVDSAAETLFLLPAELRVQEGEAGPGFLEICRFAERLRESGASLEAAGTAGGPGALPALEVLHTQGAESELRAAALRALSLHARDGVPLHEIAITARSLEPYAPFLAGTFGELGIPCTTSAASPLALDPSAAAFLGLLRALARGFERRAVINLLRRGWAGAGGQAIAPADIDRWDRWSREARVASGIAGWKELRGYVAGSIGAREAETRSIERLERVLDELAAEGSRWEAAKTLSEHASFLRDLARRRLPGGEVPPAVERILEAIEASGLAREASLRARGGGASSFSVEQVEELARRAAGSESVPIQEEDDGGVRVLDLMQARGLTHRVVLWIGFHDGLFPRRASADPFLSDHARATLSRQSGKWLGSKLEAAADEEKLLLSMTLASAGERLGLSFQRADGEGRPHARSSALREVARIFLGRPAAAALLEESDRNPLRPERLSAHPGVEALELAVSPRIGLLPPFLAVEGAAVRARQGVPMARAMLEALGLSSETLKATLSCVESLESFDPGAGTFDGTTGLGVDPDRPLSISAIERLARCPLTFFLRDILGLLELEVEVVPHRIEVRALGVAAHQALATLYQRLDEEGWFRKSRKENSAAARALELLDPLWRSELEKAAGSSHGRLRGLFEVLGDRWLVELREFVRRDLDEIHGLGVRRLSLEEPLEATISFAEGLSHKVRGRLDRVMDLESGVRVDDYKTEGKLAKKVQASRMLKGLSLQLPLYREIVASVRGAEPASVEARLLPVGPEADQEPVLLKSDSLVRQGILETVAVALRLARAGRFPILPGDDGKERYCSWCGYRRTCRKSHEPTLVRLESDRSLADFRDLRSKNAKGKHMLKGVREARASGDVDEGGDA